LILPHVVGSTAIAQDAQPTGNIPISSSNVGSVADKSALADDPRRTDTRQQRDTTRFERSFVSHEIATDQARSG
jgi:hypothetical protein